jgi:hypothetical protein
MRSQKTVDRRQETESREMEYWSIGVMEYWKEGKTPAFPPSVPPLAGLRRTGAKASAFVATLTSVDKTAWRGRQENSPGMLEEWNDGGKEIPPGLPLQKGGDQWERWKNGKGEPLGPELTAEGLMSFHSRKEGGIGKAGEDWHT